jgi:hypothetical protein
MIFKTILSADLKHLLVIIVKMISKARVLRILLCLIPPHTTEGDFIYPDFNNTVGLVFNGNASTSICDGNTPSIKTKLSLSNRGGYESTQETETNIGQDVNELTHEFIAQFGHRNQFESNPESGCPRRLRLTQSLPSQAGSVFHATRLPVIRGFDTTFSFQITAHSKVCTYHLEPMASQNHHKSCAVHGGDGFSFVIHSDKNGANAIGGDGQDLGYGGIENSVVIEFDTWANVDTQGSNDLFHDHISIHSGSRGVNSANASTMIGNWRPVELADGKVHRARVQYLPYVEEKYLDSMTANDILLPFLKDDGEGRRLGTLAVFIDDGVKTSKPILAIPLNLNILLDLPQSLAYVGFTGSTGANWENHDILEWHWCDSIDCRGDRDEIERMELGK